MVAKRYNEPRVVEGKPHALYCREPSLTKQAFKEECDINEILKRAKNGQDISRLINDRVARYGDFSNIPDYQEAMNVINKANVMFMELDAGIRQRFNNDPKEMLEFLRNPENKAEAIELGLVNKPVENPVTTGKTVVPQDSKTGDAGAGAPAALKA